MKLVLSPFLFSQKAFQILIYPITIGLVGMNEIRLPLITGYHRHTSREAIPINAVANFFCDIN